MTDLLTALSDHHPDPSVARAARKAAFKARSRRGQPRPGKFIDLPGDAQATFRTRAGHGAEGRCAISVKPIRIFGDPVLRTAAEPVRDFDAELRKLVKDLTDTMLDAPGPRPGRAADRRGPAGLHLLRGR